MHVKIIARDIIIAVASGGIAEVLLEYTTITSTLINTIANNLLTARISPRNESNI